MSGGADNHIGDANKMAPCCNDPDPLHLSRILHELAGAASMCWTPRPSTAVFDSQQAIAFVEQAIAEIRQRMRMMSTAPQPVGEVPEEVVDAVAVALRKAFTLGQRHWQQADSEYPSQHRKADETRHKFESLVVDTRLAVRGESPK